ncbi:hypothetical protein AAHA92_30349 [Salvia divinorum]|uniref:Gag-pol polyprotein n=1 Tax=Salvia divinorum TaxID=28513 RepID=A0ABD1G2A1_SALDI
MSMPEASEEEHEENREQEENEDANRHLIKFVEIANTLKINGVEDNAIRNGGGPNRPYSNYRPSQGGGFNVSKGRVIEPAKKEEKYEQRIQRILEAMQEDRKANNTKIEVVEARLNNLEGGMNTVVTTVTAIKT